ncbi:MAG: ABC transporter permease subunit [Anaerolineaceae bacterium]|nr:ABC transporter permease subunit [Anaerolineaceae bacterium]
MRTALARAGGFTGPPALSSSPVGLILRLLALAVINVFALLLAVSIGGDGNIFLALAIAATALIVTVITLVPGLWPLRWMSPALALIVLMALYPMFYTLYVSFTNFSDGHRQSKVEVAELLAQRTYLPEGGTSYAWTPFGNEAGDRFGLWLVDANGNAFFALPDQPLQPVTPGVSGTGPYDDNGIPSAMDGLTVLTGGERFQALTTLQTMQFGDSANPIGIKSRNAAGAFVSKWVFDPAANTLTDMETGTVYKADDSQGQFVAPDGTFAPIGYWVPIGLNNFARITGFFSGLNDLGPQFLTFLWRFVVAIAAGWGIYRFFGKTDIMEIWLVRRVVVPLLLLAVFAEPMVNLFDTLLPVPLFKVFGWTVAFAFLSVLTAFSLGLFMALILNRDFPGVKVIRSLLIVPYAIPGMIGILIWRGMFNSNVGVIPATLRNIFGSSPAFFNDPGWAKFMILLVNLWFAYPYFMLLCSGALQSISASIYEAAEVDGANAWHKFWSLTLPLLLVAVGPLLIASFTFNFNNFLLIEGLIEGGPPIAGTAAPPVGHTDNLMTYTYRFAFSSSGTRDFGYASAIAVMIFLIVGTLTLLQFRLTRRWEEVGENV